ncbi:hypothetical protein [Halocalculus aciditolerans]|nr:hypothetical protein [Halocalculus aciditolerans]
MLGLVDQTMTTAGEMGPKLSAHDVDWTYIAGAAFVVSPLEQHLDRLLAVALVGGADVALCEVGHPRVGVVVSDVGGVAAFEFLPDVP